MALTSGIAPVITAIASMEPRRVTRISNLGPSDKLNAIY
jgi:hypothetical protein